MPAEITKSSPEDLLKGVNVDMVKRAYKAGRSISVELEEMDPSDQYGENEQTDAFQRVMKAGGFRAQGSMAMGLRASTVEEFRATPEGRLLLPELLSRKVRSAIHGGSPSTRNMYTLGEYTPGTIQRPYTDDTTLRTDIQIAAAIPTAALLAGTRPISTPDFRAIYLNLEGKEGQLRKARILEGTEIPVFKLDTGEKVISTRKFGGGVEWTYEQAAYLTVDVMGNMMVRAGIQDEIDKLSTILDIYVNGDGNGNAATVYNQSALDPASTPGTLHLGAYRAFIKKFVNPYIMTNMLMREATATALELLNSGNNFNTMVALKSAGVQGLPGLRRINQTSENIGYGWTDAVAANTIVGIDPRPGIGVERVVNIAMTIDEIEKNVTNQTNKLVMTEAEGYWKQDKRAALIMNIAA
jgi:hypothetical protein